MSRVVCDKGGHEIDITPVGKPLCIVSGEKAILRHFRDTGAQPGGYEYPATLEQLIPDPDERNQAQADLADRGLIERAVYPTGVPEEISSCTLTRRGKKFIDAEGWDQA